MDKKYVLKQFVIFPVLVFLYFLAFFALSNNPGLKGNFVYSVWDLKDYRVWK